MELGESRREVDVTQLYRNAPVGLFQTDVEGRCVAANPRALDLFGRDAAQAHGNGWQGRIHPDDVERVLLAWRRAAKAGHAFALELRFLVPGGGERWVELAASPLADEAGALTGHAVALVDLTTRRENEEDERRSQKLEAVGTLAGGVAHDFNNILQALLGHAEYLNEDVGLDGDAKTAASQIVKGARRGSELVRNLLAFAGRNNGRRVPCSLVDLVHESVGRLRSRTPENVELRVSIPQQISPALADPVQVEQVLVHLCANARQALPSGRGVIDIALEEVSLEQDSTEGTLANLLPGSYAKLVVSDTGAGMDRQTLAQIFEPFFSTKPAPRGTGLGLSTVQGIVASHGGTIEVSSHPGEGTTFTIHLPLQPELAPARGVQVMDEPSPTESVAAKVLLIDDEEPILRVVQRGLERLGYEVSTFTNGGDAIEAFRKEPSAFDIIITDQVMPNLTGLALARGLHSIRSDVPIILCTGHENAARPEEAHAVGVTAVVFKPLAIRELADTIQRQLAPRGS